MKRLLAFLSSITVFFALSAPASATTSVQIISQPGDYIGQGAEETFTTVTAVTEFSQTVLKFTAGGFNYQFKAATGLLVPGIYEEATRYPFNAVDEPGLNISGNGRGCSEMKGRFIVHELELGSGTAINKAAIDFEQHCEGKAPALFGFIRYNATVDVVDQDADGVPDIQDNCPTTANGNQNDGDGDKIGDMCDPIQGVTLVTLKSDKDDYIGQGKTTKFTVKNGGVAMSTLSYINTDTTIAELTAGPFTFDFSGIGVNPLTVGTYNNATRYPFNSATEPGLDVSGDGRGCNQLVGSFQIFELVRNNKGIIQHFAADFVQYCSSDIGGPALRGSVRFNSEIPLTGEKAGSAMAFAGDVNGDGYGDYVVGIPGYDRPASPPSMSLKDVGAMKVFSGKDGEVLMMLTGTKTKDSLGAAVAGNGDIDGDGFDDVVVGAPFADNLPLKDSGSVTVLFGPNGARKETLYGTQAKELFGSALALGDVNIDSKADIIIGSPKYDDLRDLNQKLVDAGRVTVYSGNDLSVELNAFYGPVAKANFGGSVAAGDIDNDGNADIIIGAPNDDDLRDLEKKLVDAGSFTVYNNSNNELLKQYGAVAKAYFGKSVASGDINNDGNADVLVGAPGDDNGLLKDTGSVTVLSGDDSSELTKKYGAVAKLNLGSSVAAGDVNDDGYAEIIASAPKDDKPTIGKPVIDAGSVTVWNGNGYAELTKLYGDVAKDYFGTAIAAGDVGNDSKDDVLVGIPGFDTPADKPVKDVGKADVFSGESILP
jgi:predicted nucleotidyltransferase